MRNFLSLMVVVTCSLVWSACGGAPDATREASGGMGSKISLTEQGRILYRQGNLDSATSVLQRATSLDSTYLPAVLELASVQRDRGLREPERSRRRVELLRASRDGYARAEALGNRDAEVYDRLCELAVAVEDEQGFLLYARKNAALFPYERQYYNLGLAYFGVNDYQNVVRTQKEALEKFSRSAYLGGFYRQLGRAYMKMDRDQTAERTMTSGVQEIDKLLVELRRSPGTDSRGRLTEDKIHILLLLKRLHQTYKADDKLQQVERQLREAGYQGK